MAEVDAYVLAQSEALLQPLLSSLPSFHAALERAWEALRLPTAALSTARADRERRLAEQIEVAKRRLAHSAEMLVDGLLAHSDYKLLREKAQTDLEQAARELEEERRGKQEPMLPPLIDVLEHVRTLGGAVRAADTGAQRQVLGILIERVVPLRVGWGKYEAAITWSVLGDTLGRLRVVDTLAAAA